MKPTSHARKVVLVTGPSGAGRSTAIHALEDIGFEAIDNLPLSLMPRLMEGPPLLRPLALGLDTRNREFSSEGVLSILDTLMKRPDLEPELLYLDCDEDVLLRRFSETRRRHPLAPEEAPGVGIMRDFALLTDVRAKADTLINTSGLTPHQLRAELKHMFGAPGVQRLAVSVHSFSYKRGLPRSADLLFDCRFLRNPYWDTALRGLDGRDSAVVAYVQDDPRFKPFLDRVSDMVEFLLPAYTEEGKSHLSIAFGCTGGQHRSVAVTEILASDLAQQGWQVSIRHRELGQVSGRPE